MVVAVCVGVLLCALGVCVVAWLTRRVLDRLRIDRTSALLWLGLAEQRIDRPPARPPRPTATTSWSSRDAA
jgi:hypothetical protein